MKRLHKGFITLEDTVDITDPCYNRDVWCRMNDVKVVPGEYAVSVTYANNGRVASVEIEHETVHNSGVTPVFQEAGDIGVDSGLAGFFPHKRDYNDDEWEEFCDKIHDEKYSEPHFIDGGVCTSSGWGDGGYDAYGHKTKDGRYDVLRIVFIEDDEDEECDDDDDEDEEAEEE